MSADEAVELGSCHISNLISNTPVRSFDCFDYMVNIYSTSRMRLTKRETHDMAFFLYLP